MKLKIYKVLSLVFAALTIMGALYVISNDGNVSAGFSLIPLVISIGFSTSYRNELKKTSKE